MSRREDMVLRMRKCVCVCVCVCVFVVGALFFLFYRLFKIVFPLKAMSHFSTRSRKWPRDYTDTGRESHA